MAELISGALVLGDSPRGQQGVAAIVFRLVSSMGFTVTAAGMRARLHSRRIT